MLTVGLTIGARLALWAGPAASSMLFGLKPLDPPTMALSALLLAIAAASQVLAGVRGIRQDPMSALRGD